MLKLKLYYFGRLMWRDNSLKKILILGKLEGRKRGQQSWMASLTQWTWVWANSWRQWRTGKSGVLQSMRSQRTGHDLFFKVNLFQIKLLIIFPKSSSLLFVSISVLVLVVPLVLSRFQSCRTLCNPKDYSPPGLQAPLSMGFSRQEYWSGSPFPSLGDLSDPGIEHASHVSCTGLGSLPLAPPGEKLSSR